MAEIPCICPAGPDGEPRHTTDSVELHPKLGFRAADAIKTGLAAMYIDDPDAGIGEVLAVLREGYIVHGVASWTVVDAEGVPVPVTKGAVRSMLLSVPDAASIVADAADALYAEAVLAPLLRAASTSSPPGPTEGSTSPPIGSSDTPPTPSSPSSTTTSPTDDITTITRLHAGDSNSSQSLASVG